MAVHQVLRHRIPSPPLVRPRFTCRLSPPHQPMKMRTFQPPLLLTTIPRPIRLPFLLPSRMMRLSLRLRSSLRSTRPWAACRRRLQRHLPATTVHLQPALSASLLSAVQPLGSEALLHPRQSRMLLLRPPLLCQLLHRSP